MLDAGVLEFMSQALPPAPARVLEVGAGDGALAGALRDRGYDVVAIDPAPSGPGVREVALLELDEPAASFDAAVSVVAMHHVEPLEESCRRLAEVVRRGGALVLDEIDVERFDTRAARWWLSHNGAHDVTPEEAVANLRHHCHPLSRLQAALGEWFELTPPVYGPYLYRWDLSPEHREPEERLIAAAELPATGARIVGLRRSSARGPSA